MANLQKLYVSIDRMGLLRKIMAISLRTETRKIFDDEKI